MPAVVLQKGSKEAKAYMARLRAMRGKCCKKGGSLMKTIKGAAKSLAKSPFAKSVASAAKKVYEANVDPSTRKTLEGVAIVARNLANDPLGKKEAARVKAAQKAANIKEAVVRKKARLAKAKSKDGPGASSIPMDYMPGTKTKDGPVDVSSIPVDYSEEGGSHFQEQQFVQPRKRDLEGGSLGKKAIKPWFHSATDVNSGRFLSNANNITGLWMRGRGFVPLGVTM